jgi:hypothetical protein
MRKLVHRGKKFKTGVRCPLIMLRSQYALILSHIVLGLIPFLFRVVILVLSYSLFQLLSLAFLEIDNNKASFSDFLEDTKWLLKLAYLADVYHYLNTLNTSMQGPKENILTSTDKRLAFTNKLQVWKKHLSSGNTEMFPLLLQVQSQTDYKEVIPLIISHLESLTEKLDQILSFFVIRNV